MKKVQTKWLINAAQSSGQILDKLKQPGLIDTMYPFDALYSHLKGEISFLNQESRLPFGLPNAVRLTLNNNQTYKKDHYSFRSTLDGSRQKLSNDALKAWLAPFKQVVLPQSISKLSLAKETLVYSEYDTVLEGVKYANKDHGIAIAVQSKESLASVLDIIMQTTDRLFYLYSDLLTVEDFTRLSHLSNVTVQSNAPLMAAEQGLALASKTLDIKNAAYALDINPLVDSCLCQTCCDHTRSYLHHLYQHTPILAIQLLAVHNVKTAWNYL